TLAHRALDVPAHGAPVVARALGVLLDAEHAADDVGLHAEERQVDEHRVAHLGAALQAGILVEAAREPRLGALAGRAGVDLGRQRGTCTNACSASWPAAPGFWAVLWVSQPLAVPSGTLTAIDSTRASPVPNGSSLPAGRSRSASSPIGVAAAGSTTTDSPPLS